MNKRQSGLRVIKGEQRPRQNPVPLSERRTSSPSRPETPEETALVPLDAVPLPAPPPPPPEAPSVLHPDTQALQKVTSDVSRIKAALTQAEQNLEQDEAAELERAQTPLALTLQVVSCQFANAHFQEEKIIPDIVFDYPCPFGKQTTDQDCRSCAHVRLINLGESEPVHKKRYPHHGIVIPIKGEKQALAVGQMLSALDAKPLQRPAHQVHYLRSNLAAAESRQREISRRELERQQQGKL